MDVTRPDEIEAAVKSGTEHFGRIDYLINNLYFIMQGASPEKWQLEACEFTMSRFAGLYEFAYKGMVTNTQEAKSLSVV